MRNRRHLLLVALCGLIFIRPANAAVLISELMYHPVERPAFDTNGAPLLDISDDVHEFIELHNASVSTVSLNGWQLSGGIAFDFPAGVNVPPGGFVVVAKNPARLAAIPQYNLTTNQILGPYSGQLGNSGDTIRIRDAADNVVDSVSYSPAFPWAIAANSLGAEDEWTGLNSYDYQYRGRSLERVSFSHSGNEPANWLASPLATGPTPRRTNSVQQAVPKPIVTAFSVVQAGDGQTIIRSNQPVHIDVTFSATNGLSNVSVEYFIDNINLTNETPSTLPLTAVVNPSDGRYTGTLPGQTNRSVVRYRIRADRGAGVEAVSPRADDPFAWHAYFVSPARTSANPIYDVFISSASLTTLSTNISQSPRRITLPDPPGTPRESWQDTEPAILIYNGEVFDIQMRHHGSRYNRGAGRNSFKWQFPRYHRFEAGRESVFITDKNEEHRVGAQLYEAVDFPAWRCRYVELYLNANPVLVRLQQEEVDEVLYERWAQEQAAKYPGTPVPDRGGIFKATGVIPFETGTGQGTATYLESGEGPYYIGNCALPPAKAGWTIRQRCEWTYGPQIDGWKGGGDVEQLLTGLWAARGDSPLAPNPDLATLRIFLEANFDVERTLTYMAIRDWSGPFDNATHNYFLWRYADGRWSMVAWDLDSEFDNPPQTIFWDEYVNPQPDLLRGPHWIKDSFYKAFRNEYKQKLWVLNHTLLNPANFPANGWASLQGFANQRITSVNQQLGLGTFHRPAQPVNVSPFNGTGAFPPASLQASVYLHSDTNLPAHGSTTWIIRHSSGGYSNPVVRVTSATNLTALPISFGDLVFGETYFWKCFYTDTNGHPSLESVETSFTFGTAPTALSVVSIDASTLWRYQASGAAVPTNWNQLAFDDSGWLQGAPLFADETGPLPEPIRTPLVGSNVVTFYFRASFLFPADTNGVILRVRPVVDDGVVIYLNGSEVLRRRMPGGTIAASTFANPAVGDAVYEGPFNIPASALVTGTNVLAAEVHQAAVSENDIVFGLVLEARVPSSPGAMRLNEIMADNHGSVLNSGYAPDFIELFNMSGVAQALDQFSLSDNPERPGKFIFPPGTVIPAQGFLTVWCDDATNAPGLHTGFALDNDGQTVALFAVTPAGYQLTDHVVFGLQTPDKSIGRIANSWVLNDPTPNATNTAAALGPASSLKINEWMASSSTGPDWFELLNPEPLPVALGGLFLSDSVNDRTNTRIAALSFIGARGFRQFIADEDPAQNARHVDFRLGAGGDLILLSDAGLATITSITFGSQAGDVSQGRLPDGSPTVTSFPGSASPEGPNYLAIVNIVINELVPDIELRNRGATLVDLSGWWLSDDPSVLQKYRIADGTMIGPGEYWWVDDDELPFWIDQNRGGQVVLSHDGTYRTSATFDAYDGHPYGTVPTSVGVDFVRLSGTSFGASNDPPEVGPVVISEIQYHPPDLPADDDDYEFVELANISSTAVDLFDATYPQNRWRLRDAVSFAFPSNITLLAGERVLVLGFDPATNATARSNFLAVYDVPPGTRFFGPYSGRLDNAGDSVELVKPWSPITTPGPDYGTAPGILIDRVKYSDNISWPPAADGAGASLQRRNLGAYGNEPTNWFASGVSPGGVSSTNAPPTVALTSPANGANIGFGQPITLRANANDNDGFVRSVEFFADGFSLGQASSPLFEITWTNALPGPHTLTARARDNRLGIVTSAPVAITVVNHPPVVSLVTPTNGASFVLPTNIEATAADSDGVVVKVEFFANGIKRGEDATSPYAFSWTNANSGAYALTARATDNAGAIAVSSAVNITAVRATNIAYIVPAATVGLQTLPNPYALGMDFNVVSTIVVTRLGAFDSGSDGINASSTLTTQIFNRDGPSPTVVATTNFSSATPGELVGGSRFQTLATPIVLTNGSYSVVGYGYDGNNRNGNPGTGNVKTWTTDDGGGLLAFVGGGRFGPFAPGGFPTTLDGGPADRYAAGTFEYKTVPPRPQIVLPPANVYPRPGSNAVFSVFATGNAPLRYQWLLNGTNLPGATNATLTITNAQSSNEGSYQLVITNTVGSATSAMVTLFLLIDPLIIQQPLSQQIVSGSSVTLSVSVTNTATLPIGYRLRRNNINLSGSFISLNQRTGFFTLSGTNAAPPWTNYSIVVTNFARPAGFPSAPAILTYITDSDDDGLPDAWEAAYGFATNDVADAQRDPDNDHMSNWEEYIAGTEPTNLLSYLRIDSLTTGPGATLTFEAISNRTYTVQFAGAPGTSWSNLVDVPARATNRVEVIIDSSFATDRVYRLATPQQP